MNNYQKFYNRGHFYNQNADQEIFTKGGGLIFNVRIKGEGIEGIRNHPHPREIQASLFQQS